MAITVFCWLGVGVGLVHRIRCNFYEPANRLIRNGVLLGQTTEKTRPGSRYKKACDQRAMMALYYLPNLGLSQASH